MQLASTACHVGLDAHENDARPHRHSALTLHVILAGCAHLFQTVSGFWLLSASLQGRQTIFQLLQRDKDCNNPRAASQHFMWLFIPWKNQMPCDTDD